MDEKFMREAVKEAEKSLKFQEIPVGCVVVKDGKILSRAYNRKNETGIAIDHAEILAIKKACQVLGDWRLNDCKLYVTLEPCKMCYGAIEESRISEIIIGAEQNTIINYTCKVSKGCLANKCSHLLKEFFDDLRNR